MSVLVLSPFANLDRNTLFTIRYTVVRYTARFDILLNSL